MNRPIILASVAPEQWTLPRSIDAYKALYCQASAACREQGMAPMDSLVIAAHVLRSIGIHVPSAMEEVSP